MLGSGAEKEKNVVDAGAEKWGLSQPVGLQAKLCGMWFIAMAPFE